MKTRFRLFQSLAIALVVAPVALGQQAPFSIRGSSGQTSAVIPSGETFTLRAPRVQQSASADFAITYSGSGLAFLNGLSLTGSTSFSLVSAPPRDFALPAAQTINVTVRYTAATSSVANGQLSVNYSFLPPGAVTPTTGTLTVRLLGVAPEVALAYTPPSGNATAVPPGGAVEFPEALPNASVPIAVTVRNRGSDRADISAVAVASGPFVISGLPLLPASVDPGSELRFTVAFTPKDLGPATGALQVTSAGLQLDYQLTGVAAGPVFRFDALIDSSIVPIASGGTITVPDTDVGERRAFRLRVMNTGNREGQIAAVTITGQGYQLGELPFIPITLASSRSVEIPVIFAPTQPGRAIGQIRVGSETLNLQSTGRGGLLTFSYATGSSTNTVQNNGSVFFSPIPVGSTAALEFIIANAGTSTTTIRSVSVSGTRGVFKLISGAALPLDLAPGERTPVGVEFAPDSLGASTGSLRVDNLSFSLLGVGNAPVPVPSYSFDGPSGQQDAGQQPAVALSLAEAYPITIVGTLTLTVEAQGAADPAVSFASGGRTVSITIPANTTKAVFANGSQQIRFQTGTVAGEGTITASFASEGGLQLPQPQSILKYTVPASAPRLDSAQLVSRTDNGFTISLTGFSPSRSVTGINVQFTPIAGESINTSSLTIPVEQLFSNWYGNSQSQAFGTAFVATVPFTIQGTTSRGGSLVDAIQGVSFSLTNALGTSTQRTVTLR